MRPDITQHQENFNTWKNQLTAHVDEFLLSVMPALHLNQHINAGKVLISYAVDAPSSSLLGGRQTTPAFANELVALLGAAGLSVEARVVSSDLSVEALNAFDFVIVLCTPSYADMVKAHLSLQIVLDTFGRRHKQALQLMLCEGGFQDTAFAIVDPHYLIRDFTSVFKGHAYRLEWVSQRLEDQDIQRGVFYIEALPEGLIYALLDSKGEVQRGMVNSAELEKLCLPLSFYSREQLERHWLTIVDFLIEQRRVDIDPASSIATKMELLFSPDSSQGVGLLPDILCLKDKDRAELESIYKEAFTQFDNQLASITATYVLNKALIQSIAINPYTDESIEQAKVDINAEDVNLEASFDGFLSEWSKAKIQLLLCDTPSEVAAANLLVGRYFASKERLLLQIQCADFKDRPQEALSATLGSLKLSDSVLQQLPITILLKGYQDLAEHVNLYELNKLSRWPQLKVIVSCENSFFAKHSLLNCFLKRGSERKVQHLQVCTLKPLQLSKEGLDYQPKASLIAQKPKAAELYRPTVRWTAHHQEVLNVCRAANKLAVELEILHKNPAQNPQVFISYAWEPMGPARAQQHYYLRALAASLRQLGFRPWLDLEQMSGDINAQMADNIQQSDVVLVIGSPLYAKRAFMDTNVRKEYLEINRQQQQRNLKVIGIHYLGESPQSDIPTFANPVQIIDTREACIKHPDNPSLEGKSHFAAICEAQGLLLCLYNAITPADKYSLFSNRYTDVTATFSTLQASIVEKYLLTERNTRLLKDLDVADRLESYIDSYGLMSETSPASERFALKPYLADFLASPNQSFIALARAGSGKSMFALDILNRWVNAWNCYSPYYADAIPAWIPVYIALKDFSENTNHIINNALSNDYCLTVSEIEYLKTKPVLFICDGYDELPSSAYPNLSKQIAAFSHAKLLITSRPEAFDIQHPFTEVLKAEQGTLQSIVLSPFSLSEIEHYIRHYEQDAQSEENMTYKTLSELPGMMALIENPFMLSMVLRSLPEFLKARALETRADVPIIRGDIYEAFLQTWFSQETQGRERYVDATSCRRFAEELSFELFSHNMFTISSGASEIWQFFNAENHQIMHETMPLRFNQGEYNFLHKTIYEYLTASYLYKNLEGQNAIDAWNGRRVHEEQGILSFLTQRYARDRIKGIEPYDKLMALVIGSRESDSAIAASSAITLLNRACVPMSTLDLSRINITGADLNAGIFDGTNFEGANLTNVIFEHAWLNNASFKGANTQGIDFAEWPFINDPSDPTVCAYSPNSLYLAVGYRSGMIVIFDAHTHEKLHSHKGHEEPITSLVYHPNSLELASASEDCTVKIWDASGATLSALRKYSKKPVDYYDDEDQYRRVYCYPRVLAYRPNGTELASGDNFGWLRIWDANGDTLEPLSEQHINGAVEVFSLAYRPGGLELAVSTFSGYLLIFDASKPTYPLKTEIANANILGGCITVYNPISYSPSAKYLASHYGQLRIDLRDAINHDLRSVKSFRHRYRINALMFHPSRDVLITGDYKGRIKIWDVEKEVNNLLYDFSAGGSIKDMSYRPDAFEFAVCTDQGIKVFQSKKIDHELLQSNQVATSKIISIDYRPDGMQLAATTDENLLNLWDASWNRQTPLLSSSFDDPSNGDAKAYIKFRPDGEVFFISGYCGFKVTDSKIDIVDKTIEELEDYDRERQIDIAYRYDCKYVAKIIKSYKIRDEIRTYGIHNHTESKPLKVLVSECIPQYLSYQPMGNVLACRSTTFMELWDGSGKLIFSLEEDRRDRYRWTKLKSCFRSDGIELAWPSNRNGFYVMNMKLKKLAPIHINRNWKETNGLIYRRDGSQLAVNAGNLYVFDCKVWENAKPGSQKKLTTIDTPARFEIMMPEAIESMAISPTGPHQLATGHEDGGIKIWRWTDSGLSLFWRSKIGGLSARYLDLSDAATLLERNRLLLENKGAVRSCQNPTIATEDKPTNEKAKTPESRITLTSAVKPKTPAPSLFARSRPSVPEKKTKASATMHAKKP